MKAYTLIEILLAMSLVIFIAGISVPIYQDYQKRNEMLSAVNVSARALRSAQSYSQGMKQDSGWSVNFQSGKAIIFKGDNFAGRDVAEDIVLTLPQGVSLSGANNFSFAKFDGGVQNPGSVTFSTNASSRNITINEEGVLQY